MTGRYAAPPRPARHAVRAALTVAVVLAAAAVLAAAPGLYAWAVGVVW